MSYFERGSFSVTSVRGELMRLLVVVASVGLVIFGSTVPACAWGPAGHKIVASIAFRQLTVAEQKKVVALLTNHPRFEEDFTEKMPSEINTGDEKDRREWIFQQSAIWPDIVRGFQGDEKKEYHRPSWHYINQPIFLTAADKTALEDAIDVNLETDASEDEGANVIQALRHARSVLADGEADDEEKALMITWLMHLTGDLHQPMHSSALFSKKLFPHGDKGGNGIKTVQKSNLHSLWDKFPGSGHSFKTVRNKAIELSESNSFNAIRTSAAADLDEESWFKESAKLADESCYDTEVRNSLKQLASMNTDIDEHPLKLSDEYLTAGGKIASRRMVEAGVRLGKILKEAVAD